MELITVSADTALLQPEISKKIADFERQIKEIKQAEDELKMKILEEMERKGLLKVKTDDLAITYVAPADRESFDSKKFRDDHADLYDEYIKMTPVKASIRIKVVD